MAAEQPIAKIICAQCGAAFEVVRSRGWHTRKFCGADCAKQAKATYRPQYLREWARRNIECTDQPKTCRECGDTKPASEFHRSTNYSDGRQNRCGPCTMAYERVLHAQETPEQRESRLTRHREHCRRYNAENPEKKAEYTRRTTAKNTERHKEWRDKNRQRFRDILKVSKYRRRGNSADGISGAETRAWLRAQSKICHWCGTRCAKDATIDHLQPLSKGGKHEARNLVIACRTCNSRKSAKDPLEFAREMGKLL